MLVQVKVERHYTDLWIITIRSVRDKEFSGYWRVVGGETLYMPLMGVNSD